MIKNFSVFFIILFLGSGCVFVSKGIKTKESIQQKTPVDAYSGLIAKIIVADFELKSAKASTEISSGLREMLVSLLINSKRFNVVERKNLVVNTPVTEEIKPADLIISIGVIEFEPQSSGGSSGVGGGGGVNSGLMGGLLGGAALSKAHVSLEIKIADALTSEIVSTTVVSGIAADVTGDIMGQEVESWKLSAGLDCFASSPMEKAIRICLNEALRYIIQNIPQKYYKY